MSKLQTDVGVLQSIEYFFVYGIDAGSYTSALLRKDPESHKYAHPVLIAENNKYHEDHKTLINTIIPDVCTGANAESWQGLTNMSREQIKEIIFESKLKGCKFTEMILKEYSEDLDLVV